MSKPKISRKERELSETEWTLIWMAIRYAMNRETISSATLPEQIIRAFYGRLTSLQKQAICKDLQENFERFEKFGNPKIDHRHWMKFWKCLDTTSHIKVKREGRDFLCFQVGEKFYPLFEYIAQPEREIYLLAEDLDH